MKKEVPSLSLNCEELVDYNPNFIPAEEEVHNLNESIIKVRTYNDLELDLKSLGEKKENVNIGESFKIKTIVNNVEFFNFKDNVDIDRMRTLLKKMKEEK